MSDIFREVDEEVRREQLKKLWDRYGNYAVAALVLIVLAVAAWRGYLWWEAKQAAAAGTAFEAAIDLAEAGKHDEAAAAFAKLAADATASYRHLAGVRAAAELAHTDAKAAISAYEKIAADRSAGPVLQELASLRAAALLIDSGAFDEAQRRLEPLTGKDGTFRHTARELLVLASWRAGDSGATKRWVDLIMSDALTPPGTRSRVEMLLALGAGEAKS